MTIKIKIHIGSGFVGANHDIEYVLSDLNMSEDEWLELDSKQKQEILDDILETEMQNRLDISAWVEGDDSFD